MKRLTLDTVVNRYFKKVFWKCQILHLWREVHKCISKNFQIALNSNVQMETLKFDSLVMQG